MTIITLSNGKKVGNFSSPHPFIFEDGSVLPAVSSKDAERLCVKFNEFELQGNPQALPGDITMEFELNEEVLNEMTQWIILRAEEWIDVVFCPLPMIQAIRIHMGVEYLIRSPFRAIRMTDRIKKLVSIHKQCI